ncbi:BRO family protein [Faecalibacillus intestinalis]|jgi:prophage antirepressor-like protein|uniref:BRO family protein n=1 Tax=Faecalibacillus intestinalis TaxID=1982626 RepID=UPI000E3F9F20|nr:BRO family protein [Faecalibacillus intestinalis]RGF27450.1 phage repressor protein [Coprobacillus sp. AM09-26]
MNELKVFQNKEFGEVRSLIIGSEPWFVGKDVTNILGYKNGSRDINRHVDEEDRGSTEMVSPSGKQMTTIINESGLYSLILSSKLPTAKKFKHWVTSEVLPTLRKTGRYEIPNDPMGALKLMFEAQTQTNEKVAVCDRRITELEENKLLNPGEYNYISRAIKKKVKQVKSELNMDLAQKQNSQVYRAINRDLNCFIGIKTRSQFRAKDFDKALEFIENWQLSYTDKKIIEQLALEV